jgi:hypothetical protein
MELTHKEAFDFFSTFLKGTPHYKQITTLSRYGSGWTIRVTHPLSTFDFNDLTRLVVLAHDRCIRAEILIDEDAIARPMIISIHKRGTSMRGVSPSARHPELEEHVEEIRRNLI